MKRLMRRIYSLLPLDPKTRQVQINEGFNLIISDTVGFIQKLSTTLVAAFRSTLEEAKVADLLLHVVDASHPEYRTQYDTVNQLMSDLGMEQIPQVVIFNKKDLCHHNIEIPVSKSTHVFVSSRNKDDKDKAKQLLIQEIKHSLYYYEEMVDSTNADRLYFLKQHTLVSELHFNEDDATYSVKGYKKQ